MDAHIWGEGIRRAALACTKSDRNDRDKNDKRELYEEEVKTPPHVLASTHLATRSRMADSPKSSITGERTGLSYVPPPTSFHVLKYEPMITTTVSTPLPPLAVYNIKTFQRK